MGSSQQEPILRNRYFHGKMLTAGDFQLEQDYFNQKRQMLNRLLHGSGVVAGLTVRVQADLQTVNILPGLALDSLGREIVVPKTETCSLTTLPGFAAAGSGAPFYLCVSYLEQAVHRPATSPALLASDSHLTNGEPGYVAEGYRFSLTGQAPDASSAQDSMPVVYLAKLQGQVENGVYRIGQIEPMQEEEADQVVPAEPAPVAPTPEPVVAPVSAPVAPPAEVNVPPKRLATGTVSVSLGSSKMFLAPFNKFVERSFYTEVLEHGLGPGPVCMTIGVEDSQSAGTYYGDLDVFEDTELKKKYPDFALGVVVFPSDGTFKIGLKVKQQTDRESIQLRWWAYKE